MIYCSSYVKSAFKLIVYLISNKRTKESNDEAITDIIRQEHSIKVLCY